MNIPQKNAAKIAAAVIGFFLFEAILFLFIDKPLALFTHELDTSQHGLIDFFRSITDAGKSVWYLWPCGIATIFGVFLSRAQDAPTHVRRLAGYVGIRAVFLFAAVALSGIAATILKPVIGRARPVELVRNDFYGFHPFTAAGFNWNSMPSGHSTTVFTLAFALSHLYPRLRPVWLGIAVLLAVSRVMVDAHYLSDIYAGAALGYVTVALLLKYVIHHMKQILFPIDKTSLTR